MVILLIVNKDRLSVVPQDKVVDEIYYQRARLPAPDQVKRLLPKSDTKIKEYFKSGSDQDINKGIRKIQKTISKIDNKIPLYDQTTRNMYIVNRDEIFDKVSTKFYRFPYKQLVEGLRERRDHLVHVVNNKTKTKPNNKPNNKPNKIEDTDIYTVDRENKQTTKDSLELRKLNLMLDYLDQFDLDILGNTYVKAVYYHTPEIGKNLTTCRRPSYLPQFTHIKPYYSRAELINMGLNLGVIEPDNVYYDTKKLEKVCKLVKANDVTGSVLLEHQKHVVKYNGTGLLQYYTFNGSYHMNNYLRGTGNYSCHNKLLEDQIRTMVEFTEKAPAFDKDYVLYRFVSTAEHLEDIEVGGEYVTAGFMSCTRNPFYLAGSAGFGVIMLRINIPGGVKGVGLCVEAISNFPTEEEIILTPGTILRLDSRDKDVPYYHTSDIKQDTIRKRFEFTYVGTNPLKIPDKKMCEPLKTVNFADDRKPVGNTLTERMSQFISYLKSSITQFKTKIGQKEYTVQLEKYNSTDAYKDKYGITTSDGYIFVVFINNYFALGIEVGYSDKPKILVNYYMKHSTIPPKDMVDDEDMIRFVGNLANFFQIKEVAIYPYFRSCDFINSTESYGGNYNLDIYKYLDRGVKRFNGIKGVQAEFDYKDLDKLRDTDTATILSRQDSDEIYQLFHKIYKRDGVKTDVTSFYIWMVKNECRFIPKLEEKIDRLYTQNPFEECRYTMDTYEYLKSIGRDIDPISSFEYKNKTQENRYRR